MGKYSPLVRLGTATAARVVKAAVVALYALTGALVAGGALPLTCAVRNKVMSPSNDGMMASWHDGMTSLNLNPECFLLHPRGDEGRLVAVHHTSSDDISGGQVGAALTLPMGKMVTDFVDQNHMVRDTSRTSGGGGYEAQPLGVGCDSSTPVACFTRFAHVVFEFGREFDFGAFSHPHSYTLTLLHSYTLTLLG